MATDGTQVTIPGLSASTDMRTTGQNRFVKGSGVRAVTLADSASATLAGVLQDNPNAGEPATVAMLGPVKLVAGGPITAFDKLTSDAQGRAITATGASQWVGAIALENASGAGIVVSAFAVGGGGLGAAQVGGGLNVVPFVSAVSITDRAILVVKPGVAFSLSSLKGYCDAKAGNIAFDAVVASDTAIVTAGTLAIDSAPTKYAVGLSRYMVGGLFVEMAAATAQTFSAAHTVTAAKYGCILVQVSNAGVLSTKVVGSTQAYADAPTALAALPAADAGKLAVGYIAIHAGVADWVANTNDMTNGSGLTTAAFTTTAAVARATGGATAFVGGESVAATLSGTVAGTSSQNLLLLYTSDGTGAVTNGSVSYGL